MYRIILLSFIGFLTACSNGQDKINTGSTGELIFQSGFKPGNPSNHVLHFWLDAPNVEGKKGRIHANIYGNIGIYQFYQSVRVYLHCDFNPMKLYTSKELIDFMKSRGKTLQIYWDDYKLWKNKQPY
jgi:hypothetical protein